MYTAWQMPMPVMKGKPSRLPSTSHTKLLDFVPTIVIPGLLATIQHTNPLPHRPTDPQTSRQHAANHLTVMTPSQPKGRSVLLLLLLHVLLEAHLLLTACPKLCEFVPLCCCPLLRLPLLLLPHLVQLGPQVPLSLVSRHSTKVTPEVPQQQQ